MRGLSVLVLLALSSVAAADTKYKGATVDIEFKAAPVADVFRLIADTGRVNIVVIDASPPPLDIKVKREPWDKVLDDVIARSKLAYVRFGNLYLVGKPEWVAERKKVKKTYQGATIDLEVKDADATAAAQLLMAIAGTAEIKPGAPRRVQLRLKRQPSDLVLEVLLAQSGGTVVDKPTTAGAAAGCLAPTVAFAKLALGAMAAKGITRFGMLVDDKGGAYIVGKASCVSRESAKIKEIGQDYITFDVAGTEHNLELYKRQVTP